MVVLLNRSPMRTLGILLVWLVAVLSARAQQADEYRMEIGGGAGWVSYQGDFNGSVFKNLQPSAVVLLRRTFNPYMAAALQVSYGTLKGSSANANTYYPGFQGTVYTFKNKVADVGIAYEYNFWPYGTGREYRGAKRITPYISGGIGTTFVWAKTGNVFTANVPLGAGVKYKAAERLNIALEWSIRFTLNDRLDGVKDPYGIPSSGIFKNADSYSMLRLCLSYSFSPKCRTCHNDDE